MPHLVAVALAALVGLLAGLAGIGWLRWQYLKQRPGCFACHVVEGQGPGRRERIGLANFTPSALEWFARDSLRPAASRRWPRRGLAIKASASPAAHDAWQTVQLNSSATDCLLVLSAGASAGLLSWIEAGPTGADQP
ncbi:MAG: DUF2550 domain-containing protein [Bifidobacteriaceae bacterium]|jgi:hypothetical protein|nr:DUF2550 domain-containing protein [Bifidobacteriaceae bacterium]